MSPRVFARCDGNVGFFLAMPGVAVGGGLGESDGRPGKDILLATAMFRSVSFGTAPLFRITVWGVVVMVDVPLLRSVYGLFSFMTKSAASICCRAWCRQWSTLRSRSWVSSAFRMESNTFSLGLDVIRAFMASLLANELSSGIFELDRIVSTITGFPANSWGDNSRVALSIPTLSDEMFDLVSLCSLDAGFFGLS